MEHHPGGTELRPWSVTSAATALEPAVRATRRCFLLHVRPQRLREYVEDHQRVWSEMLETLSRSGWRNYSLFLRASDGLVVGYFESDDAAAAMDRQAREEVDARWQATMAPYFVPGSSLEELEQYFHLP
jgi:L-rhamnose mutarotase